MKKPLLLSPCGSFEALTAAVNAGADEVYFGAKAFNARNGAKNLDENEFKEAVRLCRLTGVKTCITVNTLVTDRELTDVCNFVYDAACLGADCFIVQDLGLASLLKKQMPEICLHASTQCACHSLAGAQKLIEHGFSRIVLARELCKDDIKEISSKGFETEIFVHGALCVCHSGMCLMSSAIGGRSGNRGMCAQPCRLPYRLDGEKHSAYPLSLKDLSLSEDIEDLIDCGVTSLKIEGRMKSPNYVYGVTSVWRKLIDSGKSASREEYRKLSELFSRGGFTDKYFTSGYRADNRDMYGVRSDDDKAQTLRSSGTADGMTQRKRRIELDCSLSEGLPAKVSVKSDGFCAELSSDLICGRAKSAPLSEEDVKRSLSKLGNTYFYANSDDIRVNLSENVFFAKSELNSLRREAVRRLEEEILRVPPIERRETEPKAQASVQTPNKTPKIHLSLLNKGSLKKAAGFKNVQMISIPLEFFINADEKALSEMLSSAPLFGIRFPRVIFNSEYQNALRLAKKAKKSGAAFAVVSNVGQIELAKQAGLSLYGGLALNVYNSGTYSTLCGEGFEYVTLSPELNSAQMRDIRRKDGVKTCVFAKGRLPLMALESCIIRANQKCAHNSEYGCTHLTDRKGYVFPIYGEKRLDENPYPCRNIIYNSVEINLIDNTKELKKINADICTVII